MHIVLTRCFICQNITQFTIFIVADVIDTFPIDAAIQFELIFLNFDSRRNLSVDHPNDEDQMSLETLAATYNKICKRLENCKSYKEFII